MSTDGMEWIVLRSFDNPVDAEMAQSFLHDHHVTARLSSLAGQSSALGILAPMFAIRLAVPSHEHARALRTLDAMQVDLPFDEPERLDALECNGLPYRRFDQSHLVRPHQPRQGLAACVLALTVPVGSGHVYARHHMMGLVFGCGILSCLAGGIILGQSWLTLAAGLVILCDAVLGVVAVQRYNAGRISPPRQQALTASFVVALSVLVAFVIAGAGRFSIRHAPDEPVPAGAW